MARGASDPVRRLLLSVRESPSGCLEWVKGTRKGYGQFLYRGKKMQATRFVYQTFVGNIPKGMFVCHKCDNRACVNTKHLFIGTNSDNMADMDRKGRRRPAQGSINGSAKLSECDVLEIRKLRKAGATVTSLAKQYGVKHNTVCNITLRNTWRHI